MDMNEPPTAFAIDCLEVKPTNLTVKSIVLNTGLTCFGIALVNAYKNL